jgi:hypothetical protein
MSEEENPFDTDEDIKNIRLAWPALPWYVKHQIIFMISADVQKENERQRKENIRKLFKKG